MVCLALGVLGERPVDAGDGGALSLAFAGGDEQIGLDLLDGFAEGPAPQHELPIGPWAGLGVLATWAAAALLVGSLLLHRRDA